MTVHLEKPHHMLHLVISPPPPPPKRSATSRPSRAWVLTPPLVVMVTNLLPTNHVILRPPAKRNSAMGDLEGQKKAWNGHATTAIYTIYSCIYLGSVKTMTVTINTVLYFQEKKAGGQPLWQSWEVGEDVSCHHIQTRFCELQMNSLQALVSLRHCIFIGWTQAAGGGGGVHPTPGSRKGYSREKRAKEGEERATQWIRTRKIAHAHAHLDAQRHAESHGNITHQCSCFQHAMQAHICKCHSMHITTDTHWLEGGFFTDTAVVNSPWYKGGEIGACNNCFYRFYSFIKATASL